MHESDSKAADSYVHGKLFDQSRVGIILSLEVLNSMKLGTETLNMAKGG